MASSMETDVGKEFNTGDPPMPAGKELLLTPLGGSDFQRHRLKEEAPSKNDGQVDDSQFVQVKDHKTEGSSGELQPTEDEKTPEIESGDNVAGPRLNCFSLEAMRGQIQQKTEEILQQNIPATCEKLRAENEKLREEIMCKDCKKRNRNIVYLKCGHKIACDECAIREGKCPICKGIIVDTVRVMD